MGTGMAARMGSEEERQTKMQAVLAWLAFFQYRFIVIVRPGLTPSSSSAGSCGLSVALCSFLVSLRFLGATGGAIISRRLPICTWEMSHLF